MIHPVSPSSRPRKGRFWHFPPDEPSGKEVAGCRQPTTRRRRPGPRVRG
ncbi:hypothetical protein B8V81_4741 [Paenibacillus pasadenensis]|uniref:Uncharacterized protein n=1 Tax=Paenibacillus pasadenensis TaxID=217090 RepID=A0A2N5N7N2_9BACL|nr:hypothetical protein B8V81_4741 [Paenibacillus pasadenensis]